MTVNDTGAQPFRPVLRDLALATALLTRIPLPAGAFPKTVTRPGGHAAWAYPLVGVGVGAIVGLAGVLALWLDLPPAIAALFALLAGVLTTGAMHEDGLADCADGFWGGWTRTRRLEIMKDSQIGTYGVIALCLSLGLRWLALAALLEAAGFWLAVIGAAVLSRAAMVAVMTLLPPARAGGLSRQTGQPPKPAMWLALTVGGMASFWVPAPLVAVIFCAALGAGLAAGIARAKIGGQTGDVLGATQQLTEIAVLLGCIAALR